MELSSLVFALPAAFLLDLILGDPKRLPHPIRWMGKWIEAWEPHFRKFPMDLSASGSLFAVSLVLCTWLIAWILLQIAHLMHEPFYTAFQIVLIYFSLSVRSLQKSAIDVYRAIKSESLSVSKSKLSLIVGRDVESLDSKGVIRAAVETVAENLVDGVLSPLFFAAIGGAPLALAYKMVNTLDSMVGYKDEKYLQFGKCAARLDDIANFIPARLSVPVISLASFFLKGRNKETFMTAILDGDKHHSPNAGYPEAAFAGALGIRLGGPNTYQGRLVEKPYIGERFGECRVEDIRQACDLMVLSAFIFLIPCWFLVAIF
ncbi:MAG: adenosylcobinamide-phosphate synthase CbiB [Candidatus Aminicenantaceae bacterium]